MDFSYRICSATPWAEIRPYKAPESAEIDRGLRPWYKIADFAGI